MDLLSKITLLITPEGKWSCPMDDLITYYHQAVSKFFTAIINLGPNQQKDRLLNIELAISGLDEQPFRGLLRDLHQLPEVPVIGSLAIQYRHFISTQRMDQMGMWSSDSRMFSPQIPLPLILCRLPNLSNLSLDLPLNLVGELDDVAGEAVDIVQSLTAIPGLRKLHLRQAKRSQLDSQIAIITQESFYGKMVEALSTLSPRLEELTLINMVDIHKFLCDCLATPWPNLRHLYLRGYIKLQLEPDSTFKSRRRHPRDNAVGIRVFESFLEALPSLPKLTVVSCRMYNWDSLYIPGTGIPRFCFDMFLSSNPWPEYRYYTSRPIKIPSSGGIFYMQGIRVLGNKKLYKDARDLVQIHCGIRPEVVQMVMSNMDTSFVPQVAMSYVEGKKIFL
ncbi:hypothetical protein diail_7800, partial [Diaporthe ilicicola]